MGYQALLFCPDEKTARVVTQVLTDLEFSVEPCSEPFAAVKKLMAQHFDAIVVDCENEQNATLLFKSARNSSSNQSALAVAVVEGQAGVAKAFRIGANLVLTKPINVEQSKGTLRVARGLLRKADSYKPPVTAAAVATQPAAPSFKAARPATPASAAPKPAFNGFPAQRTPIEPTVSDAPSSAFELQQDPTPEPEPTEVALLESMSDAIDSKRPASPAATSSPSKEYPWQPVSKPLSEPMASALKRAAEAAGKTPAVAPAVTRPAVPPAAHSNPSAHGSASAPAPARETPRPNTQVFAPKPAPIQIPHLEPEQVEAPPAFTGISATPEPGPEPLLFASMQDQEKTSAAGGSKKIFLIAVLAMVAIASAYYYFSEHPESAPALLQKYVHKQEAPAPTQPQATIPVQPQASAPAQTPAPAPTVATPAGSSDQPSDSSKANWQVDTIDTGEAPAHPAQGTKPSAAKTASTLVAATKPVNPTPVPDNKVLTVAKSAPLIKTKAPAPESVPAVAPPVLGVGSGASDKAIAGIAGDTASSMPKPSAPETLKISQGVTQGLLIKRVPPMYPQSAKQMHVQGTVQLQATIGKDGNVSSVKALSGEPVLAHAAIDAVKQWKYKPYTLNSEPVEIQTQITVNFKLP
jgi:periplasmic protein TonB